MRDIIFFYVAQSVLNDFFRDPACAAVGCNVTLTKASKGRAKEQEARDLMRSHTGEPGELAK